MTSIASQKHMKFTSDYPADMVMFLTSGSATVPNGTFDALPGITIPHGLPFVPLPRIVWSNTPDFAVANTFSDSALYGTGFTSSAGQQYIVTATATDVRIQRYNNSGSSKTVYYRIYCFAQSDTDVNSEVEFTKNSADKYIFNSDYNYMKLLKTGRLTPGAPVYTHGLGYTPRVLVWGVVTGVNSFADPNVQAQIISTDPAGSSGITSGVFIDNNNITWLNPNTFSKVEYRIYLDE